MKPTRPSCRENAVAPDPRQSGWRGGTGTPTSGRHRPAERGETRADIRRMEPDSAGAGSERRGLAQESRRRGFRGPVGRDAAPPPGEILMIRSACSPRPHEKDGAAPTFAGPHAIGAGFALPRVPTGGRRSLAGVPLCRVGNVSRRTPSRNWEYALSLRCAGRCRSEGPHRENWPAFPCRRAIRAVGGPARLHFHGDWPASALTRVPP